MDLNTLTRVSAVASMALALSFQTAHATSLTGLVEFSADSSGSEAQGEFWDTVGANTRYNLYVAPGSIADGNGFINHGNGAATAINIPLFAGSYTFTIVGADHPGYTPDALNLFFDGNGGSPGISVIAPIRVFGSPEPGFSANSGAATPFLSSTTGTVPGAGTLSFTDGIETVTLSDYFWERSDSANLVTGFNDGPGSPPDFTGQFTITVTNNATVEGGIGGFSVPEPGSLALLAVSLLSLCASNRAYRRSSAARKTR